MKTLIFTNTKSRIIRTLAYHTDCFARASDVINWVLKFFFFLFMMWLLCQTIPGIMKTPLKTPELQLVWYACGLLKPPLEP